MNYLFSGIVLKTAQKFAALYNLVIGYYWYWCKNVRKY